MVKGKWNSDTSALWLVDCGRFGNIIMMFYLSGGGAVGEVRNGKKVMVKESVVGEMVVGSLLILK